MDSDTLKRRLLCAIDTTCLARASTLAASREGHVGALKFGMEFFNLHGPAGIRETAGNRHGVFLDLKLHDIPATVAGGLSAILPLGPFLTTIHAAGGEAMMHAAMEAVSAAGEERPRVLAVTMLTSMDDTDAAITGVRGRVRDQVLRLAELAQACGVDGIVCSPNEIREVRRICGPQFLVVAPGIRLPGDSHDDQKRAMTPGEAIAAGASYLVAGRSITRAEDPVAAARRIVDDMARA